MDRDTSLCRTLVSVFFEYDTPKIVHIESKTVGVISRLFQVVILAYIIGFVMLYKKGYQDVGAVESAVTTKVKGISVTNFTSDQLLVPDEYKSLYNRVWDVSEYVVPASENKAFFVTTNVVITPNQTMGYCDEDPTVPGALCTPNNNTCVRGHMYLLGNGAATGNCIPSTQNTSLHVCEVTAWCPVEIDDLPMKNEAVLDDSQYYTVLIKNHVNFPKFGSSYRRNNILTSANASYLKGCTYNKETDPFCPVFRLKDIVEESGYNYTAMALKGGVVSITIEWNCDLDWDFMEYCRPVYTFRRLDNPDALISPGWNFRHSYHHEFDRRTLIKAFGVKFVIEVLGEARKFSIVPTFLNIGAGLALMGLTTIFCDIVLLYFLKARKFYKEKKYYRVRENGAHDANHHGYQAIP